MGNLSARCASHSRGALSAGLCLFVALLALAAQAEDGRSSGRSDAPATAKCRYSAEGRLVFSPRGVSCPAFAAPPAAIALGAEPAPTVPGSAQARAPSPVPSAAPAVAAKAIPHEPATQAAPPPKAAPQPIAQPAKQPAVAVVSRTEVSALLADRARLDAELTRIREAAVYEDREAARRVIEGSLVLIARHLEHEERVLQPLSAAGGR
jgi:hypothetical protein